MKADNCFKDLLYFNAIDGCPPDLMHDFLEGVLVYNLGHLMNYLDENKIIKINDFLLELDNFNYSKKDMKNRVPKGLFTEFTLKYDKGFHLSATHFWTLIKIFPFICGETLRNNRHFKHFLQLINIFFSLNDFEYDEDKIRKIENEIEKYLQDYKILYPDHLFGPPRQASMIRFESKHSILKREDHAIRNHINLTKPITMKHQEMQLYYLKSNNYFN